MLHVKIRSPDMVNQIQKWCSPMRGLRKFPPEVQNFLIKVGRYEKWSIGRTILREGHPAKYFYLLLDGELEVTVVDKGALEASRLMIRKSTLNIEESEESKRKRETAEEREHCIHIAYISAGDSFGELAFRNNDLRTSTVRTTRSCEFLIISKVDFMEMMNSEVSYQLKYQCI